MSDEPTTVAVLGGGQLGLMLGQAGIAQGMTFRFLDPSPDAPAAAVGELVTGALDSLAALDAVADGADVVTYEWEGVPAVSARHLSQTHRVAPGVRPLEVSQDRLAEKSLFRSLSVPTAEFDTVDDRDGLSSAVARLDVPAVLKTRRGGYDGKGQYVLRSAADLDAAWAALGGVPLILESFVAFRRELSIVAARGADGTIACWPVVENQHRDGILRVTRAPARDWTPALQAAAQSHAIAVLEALDFVGVGCIELFETDDALLANELAPRVHNSGHWTIEGAETSQFENHLRAILGRPLGSTAPIGVAAMVNCLGTMPDPAPVLALERAHLHDYGKAPATGPQGRPRHAHRDRRSVARPPARAAPRDRRVARQSVNTAIRQRRAPASRSLAIASASKPQSRSASSVCWPGHGALRCTSAVVREKRGAGAG